MYVLKFSVLCVCVYQVKCHRYWPSDGTRIFGNVLVELTEEVSYPDYVMRQFSLTHTEVCPNNVESCIMMLLGIMLVVVGMMVDYDLLW